MDNPQSLTRKARALESAGQDEGALALYLQAVTAGTEPDANLLARAGVLQLRLGRVEEAAETLERAADLYAASGLRNNALALCHRVLGADAQRPGFLRRLAELSALQGYRADARRGATEYASLVETTDPDGAAATLRAYLRSFPDDSVVKARLAELAGEDSSPAPAAAPAPSSARAPALDDFGLLPTLADDEADDAGLDDEPLPVLSNEPSAPAREADAGIAPLEGLEPTHTGGSWSGEPVADDSLGLMDNALEPAAPPRRAEAPPQPEPQPQPEPVPVPAEELEEDLPLLSPVPAPAPAPAPPPATDPVAALRERIAADPSDLGAHEELAALLAREADPGLDDALQAWAEQAFRSGDPRRLVAAYLAVARRFVEAGQEEPARKVFQRVLKLDPENEEAREGAGVAAPDGGEYVDFGQMVLEDEPSTRFQMEAGFPTGDEEEDFREILTAFRERIASGIDAADTASHYDLGIAFKEMGLWDDAVTQLQRALRAGSSPLATLEMLGECYYQKGEHETAVRMLERAAQLPGTSPADLEGVHNWLQKAREALGRG